MTYTPRPLDTSAVELTPDVLALSERPAEHAHDMWALSSTGADSARPPAASYHEGC
ncbi:RyR domain-containing protein [Urbifossiella limnaea]|uniref:RyR domain-containing protein n=1 Tax=Urbifossiella limnaea TaxID=2528023 RepID=UPI00192E54A8